jgi:hypothetical protein
MRAALFILLLTLALTQQNLNFLERQEAKVTVEELVDKFTELQAEIYKKVFQHFMIEEISGLRSRGLSENQVRERVLALLTDAKGPLFGHLNKYMQERLFKKLGNLRLTQKWAY